MCLYQSADVQESTLETVPFYLYWFQDDFTSTGLTGQRQDRDIVSCIEPTAIGERDKLLSLHTTL